MDWVLVPLFAATAFLYATVGFGGGSTYTAILAVWGLSHTQIPQISLMCNIIVVAGGCFHFYRAGMGKWTQVVPFLTTSIPMSFLGGLIPISQNIFLILLGSSLLLAGVRLLLQRHVRLQRQLSRQYVWVSGTLIGAVLGLLSGMVGIGGGIFLSPILYFLRWGSPKGIAAASSLFILFNSLSGLAGQFSKAGLQVELFQVIPLMVAVILGGQCGSVFVVRHLATFRVQQFTGILIMGIAIRILWKGIAI